MNKIILTLFFFYIVFASHSQPSYGNMSSKLGAFMQKNNIKTSSTAYFGVIGNAYYVESFLGGTIRLKDSSVFNPVNLRYNVLRDEMEIKTKDDTIVVQTPLLVESFEFGDRTFQYLVTVKRMGKIETLEGGYFELVVDGKMQLLMKHYKEIINASDGLYYGGWQGTTPNNFKHTKYMYIRYQGGEPYKLNLKNLKKVSGKNYHDLKKYIEDEVLILKSQKDCMKIVNYYNQLLKSPEE